MSTGTTEKGGSVTGTGSPTTSLGDAASATTAMVPLDQQYIDVHPSDVYPNLLMPLPGPKPMPAPDGDDASKQRQFSDAMRVLESCELLLSGAYDEDERENVLEEIASLKKRLVRPATGPMFEASPRSTIARQRRYTLGSEARRVLKGWADGHIEDPYPSVAEKQQLAAAANLSIKQVNDWFTNFRKRHWEDEISGRGLKAY